MRGGKGSILGIVLGALADQQLADRAHAGGRE